MKSNLSRRNFIMTASTGIAAITIVPNIVLGCSNGHKSPSDMLNIAVIGCGNQGNADVIQVCDPDAPIPSQQTPNLTMSMMARGSAPPAMTGVAGKEPINLANIYALCDVDSQYARRVFKGYPKAKVYVDYRKVLEDKSVDGVIIVTPDHTHAVIAAQAMKAGKHVYCEKPMAKTIKEVRELLKIAERTKVVTQMGNQGHAADGTRETVEWIRSGIIGDVREVWLSTDRPVWLQGYFDRPEEESVPSHLDYDLWLGPAPSKPYSSKIVHFGWRGLWDYGTGALGDMGAHIFDAPIWALDLGLPEKIQASTTPYTSEYMPASEYVIYEFEARGDMPPVTVHWTDGGIRPKRPAGLENGESVLSAVYYGDKGTMMHGTHGASPVLVGDKTFSGVTPWLPRTKNIFEDWIDAIKENKRACNDFIEASGKLTEILLLANIANLSKDYNTVLEYNSDKMEITNLPEANEHFHYKYRNGWSL